MSAAAPSPLYLLSMHGTFLKDVIAENSGTGSEVNFTANNMDKDVSCTSLWRPAAVGGGRGYVLNEPSQALQDKKGL
jgi:hypothetical protein